MSINTLNLSITTNRYDIYYIKFRVSSRLVKYFNKKFITKSLKTKVLKEAKIKADIIRGKYLEIVKVMDVLEAKQIKELVDKYIRETLEQDKNDRVNIGQGLCYASTDEVMFSDDASASRDVLKTFIGEYKQELANSKFNVVEDIGKELLESINITYDEQDISHKKFLQELLIGQIEVFEEVFNRYKGTYSKKYEMSENRTNQTTNNDDTFTFSEALKTFSKWYVKTNIQENQYKTVMSRLNVAMNYFGENSNIKELTTDDIEEYIDFLTTYPKTNIKPYRDMTFKDILNLDNIPVSHTITSSTLIKYIKAFRQMEGFLFDEGKLARRISKRANLPTAETIETEIFTKDDVPKLFKEFENIDDKKYIYYIFAYTGMRTSELWKCKINKEDDIYFFDLTYDGIDLKTKSSKRKIPLHKKLIELGIVEKMNSLQSRFKQYKVSDYFNNELISVVEDTTNKFMYGFRHTVATELKRADVEMDKISEILGHSYESSTVTKTTYASAYSLKQLKDSIDKLEY